MKTNLLFTAFLLNISFGLIAQIIHVPADQPTIQDGINAANNGDTVLVADNIYFENINFIGKAITVASVYIIYGDTNHINNTIINGSQPVNLDYGSTVTFITGEDTTSVLSGFTITGGTGLNQSSLYMGLGGGVSCYNAGAKIINNKIINNTVSNLSYPAGGGIGFIKGSSNSWVVISNNVISNNTAVADQEETFGGGIYILGSARIENNVIENNYCHLLSIEGEIQGGGIYAESSTSNPLDTLFVSNNLFKNNVIEGGDYIVGAGLASGDFLHCPASYIKNNTFSGNSVISSGVGYGSAIHMTKIYGDLVIEGNIIQENSVISEGGGGTVIYINQPFSKVMILNNFISDNWATSESGWSWAAGIWLWDAENAIVVIDGNTIKNNSGNRAGGFYACNSYNFTLTNNIFAGNAVDFGGGAIHLFQYYGKENIYYPKNRTTHNLYNLKLTKTESLHPVIANNTIVDNHVGQDGGAIFITTTYDSLCPVIMNNIFWDNEVSGNFGKDINHGGEEYLTIQNNDIDTDFIFGNWDGDGNINGDPLFIDDLYHLDNCASPCANAGIEELEINENIYYCPSNDMDDDIRPYLNTFPDIGADETPCPQTSIKENQIVLSSKSLNSYPNPFSNQTTIQFNIQHADFVRLTIVDYSGKEIQTLISEKLLTGPNQIEWNAEGLPSGIYFLRLETNGISETRIIVLLD